MTGDQRNRLLVFVVAYYAEATLKKVLERVPRAIFEEFDCEILVIDDGSRDRTFQIGREYEREHPDIPLTVLKNQYNQGYGGNQKIGYAYAVEHDFDYVALLHGDGQYAPEALPRLLEPLSEGVADGVMGSRMMTPGAALDGGMPLYKFVGNKILTFVQNRLLRTDFSEFHSGYRVYAVEALRQIEFQLNTNDFHFDTEIIIQFLNAELKLVEVPIPTFYGDEISRVDGLRYAIDVVKATLLNVAHRAGLLYQRRYDPEEKEDPTYDLKLGYPSSHSMGLAAIPDGSRVLNIGSKPDELNERLGERGCEVGVVDSKPPALEQIDLRGVDPSADESDEMGVESYEYLLMLDSVEHLARPERFFERLRRHFDHEPRRLVLTTPNVAFIIPRLMLLIGQFNYGRAGILDRTHTRLFTFRSIVQLLEDTGFDIKEVRGIPAPFPKAIGNNVWSRLLLSLNSALIRVSRSLFSYQIYVEADSTPDVEFLLQHAKRFSKKQRYRPPGPTHR